jgi:hypothetical protein
MPDKNTSRLSILLTLSHLVLSYFLHLQLTLTQWVDESSRDHHYETSINTFFRKYVAGLSMPEGPATAFSAIVVRPEAAMTGQELASLLPGASVSIETHRGIVAVNWSVNAFLYPPVPPPSSRPPPATLCSVQPQFPIPAGGLTSQQNVRFSILKFSLPASMFIIIIIVFF